MPSPNVVIIVFTMKGCGACEDYLPKFKKVMDQYRQRYSSEVLPIYHYDVDSKDQEVQNLADLFKVEATPSTVIARRNDKGGGWDKREGDISEREIKHIFDVAIKHNVSK